MTRRALIALLAPALVGLAAAVPVTAQQSALRCDRCHGELELLRQHVPALDSARALLVSGAEVEGSAHAQLGCAECHTGFDRFPHGAGASTQSCASCHPEPAADWERGVHAAQAEGGAVACAACHGVHDVASRLSLEGGPALIAMNDRCATCHETQRLPPDDPHRNEVGCHSCHAPHDVIPPERADSRMAAARQPEVCGACHEAVASEWLEDVHGQRLLAGGVPGTAEGPTCSSCHGSHPIARAGDRDFTVAAVDRCIECHEHAGRTFFGSYHGKATALGSHVAATCAECHTAHRILPASDPRSSVARANLVETCGACHEHARPRFVEYDSHPDPFDRERNPAIFYSFWFMNSLLIGTLTVFGLHTLLWWIRTTIDRRRGIAHGHGGGGVE